MINWTPEGFIGNLFATMRPYAPPLPARRHPGPPLGRRAARQRAVRGPGQRPRFRRQTVVMDHRGDPADFREYWKRNYGPTIAVYRFTAAQPDRVDDLDRDFLGFLTTWNRSGTPDRALYHAEYLLVTARKA